ncbi:nSTAND1 domain-containing NTPase [Streptomyces sp. GQFP]|uniref:nSTAND1 domain-containing NTPase n=1 Tax=Streptomyces sp. GQFP TaxID=2907545 RepID=UPI002E1BF0D3
MRELREKAGKPTYREMAQRVPYSASALSQAAAGEQLPSLAVVVAYAEALDADAGEWEERWREADRSAREAAESDGDAVPPYRGLARFEPDDSALFFGRDKSVGELLELVREHRFAAVFGPSGSGKSSLLRAGLIPALREMSGSERPAVIRVLAPGERPADTHQKALVAQNGDLDTWVIVDQFEELFTLCRDRAERDRFLDLLLAAREPESRLRVVVAVRGDFYGHCAGHRELAEAVSRANLLVGPMGRDELREVITGPATAVGLNVERALTARIIDEVTDRPGALPMLSHALLETWRRRRARTLTVAAYEEAGGVSGAIAASGEQAYGDLSVAQAPAARRILLRLIAPGDGTADTRRPAERAELETGPDDAAVVERLAAARLITLSEDTVELAHEALITGWPRLAEWIEQDRERLRAQRRLGEAARAWEELGRDPGALYRGTRLARAEELFAGRPDDELTRAERAFLTASLAGRDADHAAEVRTTKRMRTLAVAVSAFLVLALTAGLVAWQQNRASDRETAKAAARRIASIAGSLRSTDPRTAALLGVAAWRIAPLTESRSALLAGLVQPERDAFTDPQTDKDTRRYLTDGGRTLVSVTGRRVSVRDVAGHRLTASYRLPPDTQVTAVGPDARTVGLAGPDGDQLWDLAAGNRVAGLGDATLLDFGADGRSYLVAPPEGTGSVRLLRTADGKADFETAVPHGLASAAVGANGRLAALCPADGAPQVWDTVHGKRLPGAWNTADKDVCGTGTGADTGNRMVRFSPDGKRLAVVSGPVLRVWDVPGGRLVAELSSSDEGGFTQADFSRDGAYVATADDQELAVWRVDADGSQVFRRPLADADVRGLAWAPGKSRVLRYLDGATVHTYDLTANLAARRPSTTPDAAVLGPDGTVLATATRSGAGYGFELSSTRSGSVLARAALGPLQGANGDVPLLSFSPDGRTLAVADTVGSQQRLTVWDVRAHKVRTSFRLPLTSDRPLSGLALGPDGRTLLVSRIDGTEVWDTGGQAPHRKGTLRGLADDSLVLRADGRLAAGSDDQYAALPSGPVTGRALADGKEVTALAFSPDGTRLAVGDASGRVTLWDGDVRRRTGVLSGTSEGGAPKAVEALAFSPDGGTLAVGGEDSALRLWDTASQQLLGGDLPTPGDEIRSLAFSRDGATVYAAGPQMPVQAYAIGPEQAVASICKRTGGVGLTRTRWNAYVSDVPYREICDLTS